MIYRDRFEYSYYIKNNGKKVKGYINNIKNKFIYGDEKYMKITPQFAYRPDLISRYLYGTDKYAWLLAVVNNFHNTPADFAPGVTIIFTNPERL